MKFLCVQCNEAMGLVRTEGEEDGPLSVFFQCPGCQIRIALLANPMETQLVRSLGVKIGGAVSPEPFELLRQGMKGTREDAFLKRDSSDDGGEIADSRTGVERLRLGEAQHEREGDSKVEWSQEARERLNRIPGFIRPVVEKTILSFAEKKGYQVITEAVMDEAKRATGM